MLVSFRSLQLQYLRKMNKGNARLGKRKNIHCRIIRPLVHEKKRKRKEFPISSSSTVYQDQSGGLRLVLNEKKKQKKKTGTAEHILNWRCSQCNAGAANLQSAPGKSSPRKSRKCYFPSLIFLIFQLKEKFRKKVCQKHLRNVVKQLKRLG